MHASLISFLPSHVTLIYSHAPDSIGSRQGISAFMLILYPNTNSRLLHHSNYIRFTKIWCQQFHLIFACETNLLGFELRSIHLQVSNESYLVVYSYKEPLVLTNLPDLFFHTYFLSSLHVCTKTRIVRIYTRIFRL